MGRKRNSVEVVFVVIATAVGAFLRFYRIGKECLWFDEIATAGRVFNSFGFMTDELSRKLIFPPLYFYLCKIWVFVVGWNPYSLRSFSALWGIAAIPIAYMLARELFGRRAAVVASILMVFSAFNIYYSQEAKMYTMWWTLILLSNLFFVRAIRYSHKRVDLFFYVAFTAAALWTHNFTVLIILSHIVYLLVVLRPRGETKRWLLIYVAIVLLYAPWPLIIMARNVAVSQPGGIPAAIPTAATARAIKWIPVPTCRGFLMNFITLVSGMKLYFYDIDTYEGPWYVHFAYAPSLCMLALAFLIYPIFRVRSGRWKFTYLVLIAILLPSISVFLFSRLVTSLWHPRYLGFIGPFIFILAGYGFQLSKRKCIAAGVIAILLIINLLVLHFYYSDRVKKPWDDLVVYLSPKVTKKDTVFLIHNAAWCSFEYHWNLDKERRVRRPRIYYLFEDGSSKMLADMMSYRDMWLVTTYPMARGGGRRVFDWAEGLGTPEERMIFSNGLEVMHYIR